MGQTLDCFCKGIEFAQSHRPEEAIPYSYDKCEPDSKAFHRPVSPDFTPNISTKMFYPNRLVSHISFIFHDMEHESRTKI